MTEVTNTYAAYEAFEHELTKQAQNSDYIPYRSLSLVSVYTKEEIDTIPDVEIDGKTFLVRGKAPATIVKAFGYTLDMFYQEPTARPIEQTMKHYINKKPSTQPLAHGYFMHQHTQSSGADYHTTVTYRPTYKLFVAKAAVLTSNKAVQYNRHFVLGALRNAHTIPEHLLFAKSAEEFQHAE